MNEAMNETRISRFDHNEQGILRGELLLLLLLLFRLVSLSFAFADDDDRHSQTQNVRHNPLCRSGIPNNMAVTKPFGDLSATFQIL